MAEALADKVLSQLLSKRTQRQARRHMRCLRHTKGKDLEYRSMSRFMTVLSRLPISRARRAFRDM